MRFIFRYIRGFFRAWRWSREEPEEFEEVLEEFEEFQQLRLDPTPEQVKGVLDGMLAHNKMIKELKEEIAKEEHDENSS